MALDLSSDYLLFDDPVTVTFYEKVTQGQYAPGVSVPYAQKNAMRQAPGQGDSFKAARTTVFHLWRSPLTGAGVTADPKPFDVIEHGGARYTVREVEHDDRDAGGVERYRCTCTREVGP